MTLTTLTRVVRTWRDALDATLALLEQAAPMAAPTLDPTVPGTLETFSPTLVQAVTDALPDLAAHTSPAPRPKRPPKPTPAIVTPPATPRVSLTAPVLEALRGLDAAAAPVAVSDIVSRLINRKLVPAPHDHLWGRVHNALLTLEKRGQVHRVRRLWALGAGTFPS